MGQPCSAGVPHQPGRLSQEAAPSIAAEPVSLPNAWPELALLHAKPSLPQQLWDGPGLPVLPGRATMPTCSADGESSTERPMHSAPGWGAKKAIAMPQDVILPGFWGHWLKTAGDSKGCPDLTALGKPRRKESWFSVSFKNEPVLAPRWREQHRLAWAQVWYSQAPPVAAFTEAQSAAGAPLSSDLSLCWKTRVRAAGGREEHCSGGAASANGS